MTTSQELFHAQADSVGAALREVIGGTARGTVLAAFERSAYLDLDGRIAALASAGLGRGPFTIGLRDVVTLSPRLAAGDAVSLRDGALQIGRVIVDVGAAVVWDPALPRAGSETHSDQGAFWGDARKFVIDALLSGAPPESVAPLLAAPEVRTGPVPQAARAGLVVQAAVLEALARGLSAIREFLEGGAVGTVTRAVTAEMAGRGPGLTPSGDDVLVGIMHAITVWPALAAQAGGPQARSVLADAALPRTTRISGAYLEAAARGWATEPWHSLVQMLGRRPTAIRAAVRRILRVGETSGADALTGFCWAWSRLVA